ncbi:MAG: hypothetical protein K9G58_10030 [Bacteroidales bacterium]|nr:hypothetical protein [Bacteroidales bacterium]MCF8388254.1 hypothetical protein [Bacteroidales bacterium]MCF8398497.1 hypothetical protein [Bacteroidales bacterium]
MRKLLLTLILTFALFRLYPQETVVFSNTREAYLQEVTELLLATRSDYYENKSELLLEEFGPKWLSERFDPEIKDEVIFTSNMMMQQDIRVFPDFLNFLIALNEIAHTTFKDKSVIAWLRSLEPMIMMKSTQDYDDYIEFSVKLFREQILHDTRSVVWKYKKGEMEFVFDSIPALKIRKAELVCATRKDSSVIVNTSGSFNINELMWYGSGGRIDWRRVGLDTDKTYAEILGDYEINIGETDFHVDSVRFFNKYYFQMAMPGRLEEKVLSSPPNNRTSYPRFTSFYNQYELDDVFRNVDYRGGISMEGARLYGTGIAGSPAVLDYYKGDTLIAKVRSTAFQIQEDKIVSSRSSISLYYQQDSIYHPGLDMKYTDDEKMLTLYRTSRGLAQSPFLDSYHNVDIYCEALYWNTAEPKVSFESIRGLNTESNAYFESAGYYSDHDYYKLQGIDPVNPLDLVKDYARDYGTQSITINAFSQYLDKPAEQVKAMLYRLAARGFLIFDIEDGRAHIKQRLYDYLDAKAGLKDYDVIRFASKTKLQSNAELSLNNFDLKINGVREIFLSDSQHVYIYPKDQEILMQENRDFIFSGLVRAGLFDFYANQCSFEYDTFRLNLPAVDSLSFMVKSDSINKQGNPLYVRVKNVIARLSGDLLIDKANNKSGLKSNAKYPIFNSKNDSYVFYDYHFIQKGVYDKERFYYQLDPFVIRKLDNFSTDDLQFSGSLASDGIFPPIEEPLVVMPDYSLGFETRTPATGWPVYDEKGQFFNKIRLDNHGLVGEGKLEYLTSVSTSSAYYFYLDSLGSSVATFEVAPRREKTEFPAINTEMADLHWLTDTNLMYVNMIDNPFEMFSNNSVLEGDIELSPQGVKGRGVFNFTNAEIVSRQFDFYHHSLSADSSDFRLLTADAGELAISTEDYKTFIDFEERIGNFISLGNVSLVEFPFNQYISSMDEMTWLMDEQKIEMFNNMAEEIPYLDELNLFDLMDFDFTGSEFISTRQDQDSLAFFSQKAVYDMQNYIISAEGVKIIKVADAGIFPGDGKVRIYKDAKVESLNDAYIIADTASKYHTFYDATATIFNRHKYIAKGNYDYIDKNDTPQRIEMSLIEADSNGMTRAYGNVPEGSIFFLSPDYLFIGDVSMKAARKHLRFEGGFRINQDCYYYDENWVRFDTVLDPRNIVFPVTGNLRDLKGNPLHVGLYHSVFEDEVYPVFLTTKNNAADQPLITSTGKLLFNENLREFRVGSFDRITNKTDHGPYLNLSASQCEIRGQGTIDFGTDLYPLYLRSFGEAAYLLIPDSTRLRVSMMLDFPFNTDLLEMFGDSLKQSDGEGVDPNNNIFKYTLNELLGKEQADEILQELNLYGTIRKFPDELNYALLISDVRFVWNASSGSFISKGKIGIGSIQDQHISKYIDGFIEIERRRSGDAMHIYLQPSEERWYFFSYRGNVMQAISSDQGFNTKLSELEPGERTVNVPERDTPYEFVISTRRKQVDFVRRMENYFN